MVNDDADFLSGDADFLGGDNDLAALTAPPSVVPADVASLQQGLGSTDVAVVIQSLGAVTEQRVEPLQDQVATLLLSDVERLGKAGIDAVLDCLEAIGDGRCVREMERALYESGDKLSEHQAWRARHIVQKIRRFGRK